MTDVRFTLKSDCEIGDIQMLSPKLLVLFSTVLEFADTHKLPVKITSIISDRKNVVAKSRTHETGRALDISTVHWDDTHILRLKKILLDKHSDIAALSASDYKPRPLVWHNYKNQGDHIHLQVRP